MFPTRNGFLDNKSMNLLWFLSGFLAEEFSELSFVFAHMACVCQSSGTCTWIFLEELAFLTHCDGLGLTKDPGMGVPDAAAPNPCIPATK